MSVADAAPFKACPRSSPHPGTGCPTAVSQAGYCSYDAGQDQITCDLGVLCDQAETTVITDGGSIVAYGSCTLTGLTTTFCCTMNAAVYPVNSVEILGTAGDDILAFRDGSYTLTSDVTRGEIFGFGGEDTIDGSDQTENGYAEKLWGGALEDHIDGHGGDDRIYGQGGPDRLYGGDGDDVIFGGQGGDFIYGDDGDDVLFQGPGGGVVWGNSGNDTLVGGTGVDLLDGGDDNDILYGLGNTDTLWGQDGTDTLIGGGSDDWLEGGDDGDRLIGGPGDDMLLGGWGWDTIWVGLGYDTLVGEQGGDRLCDTEFDDDNDPTTGGSNLIIGGIWDPYSPTTPSYGGHPQDQADVVDDLSTMPVQDGFNDVENVTADWVSWAVWAPGGTIINHISYCDDIRAEFP